MRNFVLIGAAGYVAPRHMQAIRDTGNNLIAVVDPSDSVGVLDKYFKDAEYFSSGDLLYKYLDENNINVDYMSICSPNNFHYHHIKAALGRNMNVICEKPLVIEPYQLNELSSLEKTKELKINAILQLRLHPAVLKLKKMVDDNKGKGKPYDVNMEYITGRGRWYDNSWKSHYLLSGGLLSNIGIHLFDMLLWIFGAVQGFEMREYTKDTASGFLILENAIVNFTLSTRYDMLPDSCMREKKTSYRNITVDGEEIEFSDGFTDLHTKSYDEILRGNGFGIEDVTPSIDLVSRLMLAVFNGDMI